MYINIYSIFNGKVKYIKTICLWCQQQNEILFFSIILAHFYLQWDFVVVVIVIVFVFSFNAHNVIHPIWHYANDEYDIGHFNILSPFLSLFPLHFGVMLYTVDSNDSIIDEREKEVLKKWNFMVIQLIRKGLKLCSFHDKFPLKYALEETEMRSKSSSSQTNRQEITANRMSCFFSFFLSLFLHSLSFHCIYTHISLLFNIYQCQTFFPDAVHNLCWFSV